jgi:amino acid permease
MEEEKANQKEKKEEAPLSNRVDELLKGLEGEESNRVSGQEEILRKMQENPLATLAVGAVIGAALVYFFTMRTGQMGPGAVEQDL